MVAPGTTCWTVLKSVARGSDKAKKDFSRRYAPAVRAYLETRWLADPLRNKVEQGLRLAFEECYGRTEDLPQELSTHDAEFRRFLFEMTTIVAHRIEAEKESPFDGNEEVLKANFDRAFVRLLLLQAAVRHAANVKGDPEALRRLELLRLRYYGGMELDSIANVWHVERDKLDEDYEQARREFETALMEVVTYHHPRPKEQIWEECEGFLALVAEEASQA